MKKIGKILCFCMLFLGFSMNAISLRAEETVPETGYTVEGMRFNWKDGAVHIKTKDYGVNEIRINMSQENYTVKNVKSSSKNLRFWTSRTCVVKHYENEEDKDYYSMEKRVYLSMFAKKSGSYKVSFDVCDKEGNCLGSETLKVFASKDTGIKSFQVAGKKISLSSHTVAVFKENVTVKVSLNKGYKLKKIERLYEKKNYDLVSKKKIKNGQKVKVSKKYRSTLIRVTYVDKYTKKDVVEEFWLENWKR